MEAVYSKWLRINPRVLNWFYDRIVPLKKTATLKSLLMDRVTLFNAQSILKDFGLGGNPLYVRPLHPDVVNELMRLRKRPIKTEEVLECSNAAWQARYDALRKELEEAKRDLEALRRGAKLPPPPPPPRDDEDSRQDETPPPPPPRDSLDDASRQQESPHGDLLEAIRAGKTLRKADRAKRPTANEEESDLSKAVMRRRKAVAPEDSDAEWDVNCRLCGTRCGKACLQLDQKNASTRKA